MPECGEIGLMLSAAGDGELEPGDLREVARHVRRCASCTGELSDYSAIGRELRTIAAMPSLEGFTKSVLDVIAKLVAVAIFVLALHGGIFRPGIEHVARSLPETVTGQQPASPVVVAPPAVVEVRVDSALLAGLGSGTFDHTSGRTESGRMIVFALPGGRTLHVQPRALDGGVIAMEVVLFDGKRPTMTANMNLESGDTFAVGGEKYGEGTLLIRISPSTTPHAS